MATLRALKADAAEADQPVKPGWLSTEFVAYLLTQVFVLLALVGAFDVHCHNASIRVVALGASAFVTGLYAHSRAAVKSAAALTRTQRGTADLTPEV